MSIKEQISEILGFEPTNINESMTRIENSFKVELINEYRTLHKQRYENTDITKEEFKMLMTKSVADLQFLCAVMATSMDLDTVLK